jgi:hypothetical protein
MVYQKQQLRHQGNCPPPLKYFRGSVHVLIFSGRSISEAKLGCKIPEKAKMGIFSDLRTREMKKGVSF